MVDIHGRKSLIDHHVNPPDWICLQRTPKPSNQRADIENILSTVTQRTGSGGIEQLFCSVYLSRPDPLPYPDTASF